MVRAYKLILFFFCCMATNNTYCMDWSKFNPLKKKAQPIFALDVTIRNFQNRQLHFIAWLAKDSKQAGTVNAAENESNAQQAQLRLRKLNGKFERVYISYNDNFEKLNSLQEIRKNCEFSYQPPANMSGALVITADKDGQFLKS